MTDRDVQYEQYLSSISYRYRLAIVARLLDAGNKLVASFEVDGIYPLIAGLHS
jgi:hypothetical protein